MKRLLSWLGLRPAGPRQAARLTGPERLEDRLVPSAVTALHVPATVQPASFLKGDFNGDGADDVARMTRTGIWQVGLSQTQYFHLSYWDHWFDRSSWRALVSGDFDGNGKDDIAGLDRRGYWQVGLSDGQGFNSGLWAHVAPAVNWSYIGTGDFNGDGDTDIVGMTRAGEVDVLLSTGSSFYATAWADWGSSGAWQSLQVGDFNGDKKDDLAGLSDGGALIVGLSQGRSFNTQVWADWSGSSWVNTQVGDFDGDKKADIAGLDGAGQWHVARSTGTSFATTTWGDWFGRRNWTDVQAGDFNHDGKTDLAGLRRDGLWIVSLSDGKAFDNEVWGRWRGRAGTPALAVGDFNGDKKADVAGWFADGSWRVARSDGGGFQTALFGRWPLGLDGVPRYRGEQPPYLPTSPWTTTNRRSLVNQAPQQTVYRMDFNSRATYKAYVENFRGVLRAWVIEARLARLYANAPLLHFLRQHLQEHFRATRSLLAGTYRGLTDSAYYQLMALNLAHGHLDYATAYSRGGKLFKIVNLVRGDCSEIADLTAALLRAEGFPAHVLGVVPNYQSPNGLFVSGHQVAYTPGMWLDAEANVGFGLSLNQLGGITPSARMMTLLSQGHVYGFYNWYNNPLIRARQLARNLDGGIVNWYYYYFLEGYGQGKSLYYFVNR